MGMCKCKARSAFLCVWWQVHELVTELKHRLEKFNLIKVQPRSECVPHKIKMEEPGELSPKDSLFLKVHHCALPPPHLLVTQNCVP